MRQSTEAGFAVDSTPRAVFLPVVRPKILGIMAWSRTAENCGFYAVAVHCWSSTFFRSAEAVPHGLDCSADHRDSPVAVRFLMSPLCGSCRFSGAAVEKTVSLPQFAARTLSTTSYLAVTCSVFAFRVQDSGLFWVLTCCWFNTGYMSTSVYGGVGYFSHIFYVKVDLGSRFCAMLGSTVDTCFASVFETFWPMSLLCSSYRFSWVPSWRRQSSSDGCIR